MPMNRVTLYFVLVISLTITSKSQSGSMQILELETIDKGGYSKYEIEVPSRLIEIYSKDQWLSFWSKHTYSGRPGFRIKSAPYIDFNDYYILVAIDHTLNTGTSSIRIKSVETSSLPNSYKPLSVTIESEHAGLTAMVLAMNSRPYHIVKIPKKLTLRE